MKNSNSAMRRSALQKYHFATRRTHDSNGIHFQNVHCLMDVHTCLNRSVSQWQKDKLYGAVRYGTVRYGAVRYGAVRYGTVRCGAVRYGTVRYGTVRFSQCITERCSGTTQDCC